MTRAVIAICSLAILVEGAVLVTGPETRLAHLFYDDAISDEPNVAFQLMADADANGDNAVTLDELAAVDIRAQARYQVGSLKTPAGHTITNLRQFLEYQVITLGHINGEGHCEDQRATP